jgi:hypothetical protein
MGSCNIGLGMAPQLLIQGIYGMRMSFGSIATDRLETVDIFMRPEAHDGQGLTNPKFTCRAARDNLQPRLR